MPKEGARTNHLPASVRLSTNLRQGDEGFNATSLATGAACTRRGPLVAGTEMMGPSRVTLRRILHLCHLACRRNLARIKGLDGLYSTPVRQSNVKRFPPAS